MAREATDCLKAAVVFSIGARELCRRANNTTERYSQWKRSFSLEFEDTHLLHHMVLLIWLVKEWWFVQYFILTVCALCLLRLCDFVIYSYHWSNCTVCPVTGLYHGRKRKSQCVFISLALRVNPMMIHNTQAAVHFKHKSDPDRCIWLSSNIWNHETFLSSYITHRTPGSRRLIALLPTCLWRDGSPLLFYSFLSLHPKRLCHLSLSHLPFEMNYITSSVNNLWMCAVA